MSKEDAQKEIDACADKLDSDIIVYDGNIKRPNDDRLINLCEKNPRRTNVLFFIQTSGGSPAAAYRMARCLQQKYEKFSICIFDYCKSAGTLVAIGANEVIMGDIGELGPLDIQLQKTDELFEMSSGLNIMNALAVAQTKAYAMFEQYLLELKTGGGQITLKTAAEMASNMTIGLFGKVYEQIDPVNLGEISRSMKIAEEYGNRLNAKNNNLKNGALDRLITGYPSHDFVIDQKEAADLFTNVRTPNDDEAVLFRGIRGYIKARKRANQPLVDVLSTPSKGGEKGAKKS